jgi:hypothetical protein
MLLFCWMWSLLACLLTPWSRVLLQKLTGFQLVKKFPSLYGTRKFITAFTSAWLWLAVKLAYLFTYLLTPWSRVLLEKLTGFQLVKKFLSFYRTRWFITAFTSALLWLAVKLACLLLEKLTGFQLIKKFPAFYEARKFITAFTSALLWLAVKLSATISTLSVKFVPLYFNTVRSVHLWVNVFNLLQQVEPGALCSLKMVHLCRSMSQICVYIYTILCIWLVQ